MKKLEDHLPEIGQTMAASTDPFVAQVGHHLLDVADAHTNYARVCPAGHMIDDVPCDEFEQALSLGLSWLLGHQVAPPTPTGVTADAMPDMCHDRCVPNDHHAIVFPHRWADGTAHYEDAAGHTWNCAWGHSDSGSAPENRGRDILAGTEARSDINPQAATDPGSFPLDLPTMQQTLTNLGQRVRLAGLGTTPSEARYLISGTDFQVLVALLQYEVDVAMTREGDDHQ